MGDASRPGWLLREFGIPGNSMPACRVPIPPREPHRKREKGRGAVTPARLLLQHQMTPSAIQTAPPLLLALLAKRHTPWIGRQLASAKASKTDWAPSSDHRLDIRSTWAESMSCTCTAPTQANRFENAQRSSSRYPSENNSPHTGRPWGFD